MTEETTYGETPSGGVKMTAFYYDADGNPADESVATDVIIHEYDKDGHVINTIHGVTKNRK